MDPLRSDWRAALAAATAARRVMVIGATDTGKSHFVRQVLESDRGRALADLDPGQKMVGAPGTLSLGSPRGDGSVALERFAFIGSTSPAHQGEFVAAVRTLLTGKRRRLIVNTPGLVDGPGVRLQKMTIAAVRPDLIIAIAEGSELDPVLAGVRGIAVERVRPSSASRRKSAGERRRARRQAFAAALVGGTRQTFPADIAFRPAPPASFAGTARPVCAIADGGGRHLCLGVVEQVDAAAVTLFAPRCGPPMPEIFLGRMWAEPFDGGWRLLDRLQPSWTSRLPDIGGCAMPAGVAPRRFERHDATEQDDADDRKSG